MNFIDRVELEIATSHSHSPRRANFEFDDLAPIPSASNFAVICLEHCGHTVLYAVPSIGSDEQTTSSRAMAAALAAEAILAVEAI